MLVAEKAGRSTARGEGPSATGPSPDDTVRTYPQHPLPPSDSSRNKDVACEEGKTAPRCRMKLLLPCTLAAPLVVAHSVLDTAGDPEPLSTTRMPPPPEKLLNLTLGSPNIRSSIEAPPTGCCRTPQLRVCCPPRPLAWRVPACSAESRAWRRGVRIHPSILITSRDSVFWPVKLGPAPMASKIARGLRSPRHRVMPTLAGEDTLLS
ncbi:uncharacterized protein LOC121492217 [Vulpes lagopus]|uniref:uncharacterized protein LOC121492217 n=1 Tax=Vulpes lagopus TaxID=494514 RepID=UPI001BCA2866|nr:uncharacterized protein LOC121492217 [Vulpes lagopus]